MSSAQPAGASLSVAEMAMQRGDAAAALRIYAGIVRHDEALAPAWFGFARCLQALGRDEDALQPMLCALLYGGADAAIAHAGLQYLTRGDRLKRLLPALQGMLADLRPAARQIGWLASFALEAKTWGREVPIRLLQVARQMDPDDIDLRRRLVGMLVNKQHCEEIVAVLGAASPDSLSDSERGALALALAGVEREREANRLEALSRKSHGAEKADYVRQAIVQRRSNNKAFYLQASRNTRYMDYPSYIHLETLAVCNAACNFCPYPTLERQGTRMPEGLIAKVLRDLQDVPQDLPFTIAPFKVSDPFIEKRLFDIIEAVRRQLPSANIALITNAAAMTDRHLDRLSGIDIIRNITVSLNDHRPEEYTRLMGIPYARTIARMRALHQRYRAGDFRFEVSVSRVCDSTAADLEFRDFVKNEFPGFLPTLAPRNDWIGQMDLITSADRIPDVGCDRWFMMSITATGKVALCCMDGEEKHVIGDVARQHVLEIYNSPGYRVMRETLASRRQAAAPCNGCTYV